MLFLLVVLLACALVVIFFPVFVSRNWCGLGVFGYVYDESLPRRDDLVLAISEIAFTFLSSFLSNPREWRNLVVCARMDWDAATAVCDTCGKHGSIYHGWVGRCWECEDELYEKCYNHDDCDWYPTVRAAMPEDLEKDIPETGHWSTVYTYTEDLSPWDIFGCPVMELDWDMDDPVVVDEDDEDEYYMALEEACLRTRDTKKVYEKIPYPNFNSKQKRSWEHKKGNHHIC